LKQIGFYAILKSKKIYTHMTSLPSARQAFQLMEDHLMPFAFQKKHIIRLLQITLLIGGHALIEDLPGVGKTTIAKAFAAAIGKKFVRIQGTSDTLPQDILGGEVIDFETKEFHIKKGPIFEEVVLIDEINRMHPKTQSAFLEAMEEKQVSIAGKHFKLPQIHLIIATQNPLELKGTYPLPEAQRDRFACLISIGFPDREVQKKVLAEQQHYHLEKDLAAMPVVVTEEDIHFMQQELQKVTISDEILHRLIDLAENTRDVNFFRYGISPRGLAIFTSALRASALLQGREYVLPEDGKELIVPFCSHRIEYANETISKKEIAESLLQSYIALCKAL
jgi:MoxR-like ATPase